MNRIRVIVGFAATATLTLALSIAFAERPANSVLVTDEQGRPIEGASVEVVALSINYPKRVTDADGGAVLSTIYIQPPKWLNVEKAGYLPANQDFPSKWPHTVKLKKGTPATRPATTKSAQ